MTIVHQNNRWGVRSATAFLGLCVTVTWGCGSKVGIGASVDIDNTATRVAAAPALGAMGEDAGGSSAPVDASSPYDPCVVWYTVAIDNLTQTAVCQRGGESYAEGATFASSDACNGCTCNSSGQVECSTLNCTDAPLNSDSSVNDYQSKVVILATGQKSPVGVAVDDTNLYWYSLGTGCSALPKSPTAWADGQLMKCAIDGCSNRPTELVHGLHNLVETYYFLPRPLIVDGDQMYFADSDHLLNCNVAGCGSIPKVIGQNLDPGMTWSLSTDHNYLYATARSQPQVYAYSLSGGGSDPAVIWSSDFTSQSPGLPWAMAIALDASGVYWSTALATLMKCGLGGCDNQPTELMSYDAARAAAAISLFSIALDEDNIYFTDGNPCPPSINPADCGKIFRCAKSGCPEGPTMLADKIDSPKGIATDGVNVYWTEGSTWTDGEQIYGEGSVRKCAVGGCDNAPVTIADGLRNPMAIAVDTHNVYWVERGVSFDDGRVSMAAN